MKITKSVIFLLLGVLVLGALMFRSNMLQAEVKCSKVEIAIYPDQSEHFISEELIRSLLINETYSVEGEYLDSLSLETIETEIEKRSAVKEASVYYSLDGTLGVQVVERQPIVRIQSAEKGFYIDEEGKKMPLSELYTARVITVSGEKAEEKCDEIYKLVKFINGDKLLKAQIVGIFVNQEEDFVLIPSFGDHQILLGDISSLENKFENLKHTYREIFNKKGWNHYSLINLKYENQIVCTKK